MVRVFFCAYHFRAVTKMMVNPRPLNARMVSNNTIRAFFMFGFEVNDSVVVEQRKVLEQALSTNPKTQKALQKLIQQVLKEAREQVVRASGNALASDPRGAAHGIRRVVYKKLLGANLNILNMRKSAGKPTNYEPPRKLRPHQRGGNRVPRGSRTDTVMHYGPHDRSWILRIVNSGTRVREAGTRSGRLHGSRGAIAPRNFFGPAATNALSRAADNLVTLIDTELETMLNKTK